MNKAHDGGELPSNVARPSETAIPEDSVSAQWYPYTDSAGNYKFTDHDAHGTLVRPSGEIVNNVSWLDALRGYPDAVKHGRDLPVVIGERDPENVGPSMDDRPFA